MKLPESAAAASSQGSSRPALLALEDGNFFEGTAIGVPGTRVGEVIFNTSMTGYQEILTDPSYTSQLITFTSVHIGNTGMTQEDAEAKAPWAAGLIIRTLSPMASSWRSELSLPQYMVKHNMVGICDIDTRHLTVLLREKGALKGCLTTESLSREEAVDRARAFPGLQGADLVKTTSTPHPYQWKQSTWQSKQRDDKQGKKWHILAYDFGVKHNLLRMLVERGCEVTVIPAETSAEEVLANSPDGVLLSNGPGDPQACLYAIAAIKKLLAARVPLFGVCLGHQLLALACGAKTVKMYLGHHGANHPVKELSTGRVFVSSQNHGFSVDERSLPPFLKPTHRSLFDGSLEGIECTNAPAFGFQGHPEASPGPHDLGPLFDHFISLVEKHSHAKTKRHP